MKYERHKINGEKEKRELSVLRREERKGRGEHTIIKKGRRAKTSAEFRTTLLNVETLPTPVVLCLWKKNESELIYFHLIFSTFDIQRN